MPKMKTHRGAAKRFETSKSGKFTRKHAFASHLNEKKNGSRRRRVGRPAEISPADRRGLRRLLPHG